MKTVLITGAAGFIGSHLTDAYLQEGRRVIGIDNLITGSRDNLADALRSEHFELLERDITVGHRELIDDIHAKYGPIDLVLHFASPASPVDYAKLPLQTLAVNSKGTEFCAQAALEWGARLLYASTSEAYGDPLEHPQRETYWGNVNPVGPRSCYDESKRFGEALVSAYVRAHDVNARIIRIFNTYGPRMRSDDGRVVPNFILQALRGEPLTIYGNGSQTRSFCYVDDLVAGIMACAASDAARGRIVNLGNPEEYPVAEFARIVSEIADVPLRTENRPIPPDDPTRRCPDIAVARLLLGWEPKVPVREGLRRTIEALRGTLPQAEAPSA
ncbi:MAG TPA: SDR family NAD(P)-dependent oxidoreductase [Candidatus Baltobacteraceae bacterium]|nr:SDR family NAD(P)-dependent oxidoreductase [Candidatus Baltobacteraceae bacterium]